MEKSTVADIMSDTPVSIGPDANVYDAAQLILVNQLSGLTVVDETDSLVGVLSELDCLRSIVTSVYNGADPGGALVRDVMTNADLDVASPEQDIISVAKSMLENKRRRRPVVKDGQMVGQLTCRQILAAVTDMIDEKDA